MGPAGGVVEPVVPVVVVPVPAAVRSTPATPEVVVVPLLFFIKYHMAAPAIASSTRIQSQLSPPPVSVAGGGVVGAGAVVV